MLSHSAMLVAAHFNFLLTIFDKDSVDIKPSLRLQMSSRDQQVKPQVPCPFLLSILMDVAIRHVWMDITMRVMAHAPLLARW